jgi:carboxylesterase type B
VGAYTATQRTTMIFDNECKAVNDHRREERLALSAIKPEHA